MNEELPILNDDKCPICRQGNISLHEIATELVENVMYIEKSYDSEDKLMLDMDVQDTEYIDKTIEGYEVYCHNPQCHFQGRVKLGDNFNV